MWWQDSVKTLKGVGAKKAADLESLGILTVGDLLYFYPRQGAYLDYSKVKSIRELSTDGSKQLFRAKVLRVNEARAGRKQFVTVTLYDATGYADLYLFGAQRFVARKLRNDDDLLITGQAKAGRINKMVTAQLIQPYDGAGSVPGIVPVYALAGSLTQKNLRDWVRMALSLAEENLPESLPGRVLRLLKPMPRLEALRNIHFPASSEHLRRARARFIFEELFLLQCGLLYYRQGAEQQRALKLGRNGQRLEQVLRNLPFRLTAAQNQAWEEIGSDLEMVRPMHRILQGDVGSGKTAVAALALAKAAESGYQACMMAPTEILARQHYATLCAYLAPAGLRVGLLVGGLKVRERRELLAQLRAGEIDVLVGTHALLQDDVVFSQLALVITDEQHRFGVEQRAKLASKAELSPHVLVMTATPIPRTLALTVYGDLDISKMTGRPPGRKPVQTLIYGEQQRLAVYKGVAHQAALGHQVYVICPLIEESEAVEARSAEDVFREMTGGVLRHVSCGLLHGRMSGAEKDAVMGDFAAGKIQVLFSTTVVEVGVNVPNATLMVIESAERFGLAQLHQLRGRVGRGEEQSYCALLMNSDDEEARERLEVLAGSDDGFYLAEQDLRLRGAGQLFGLKQHGLPDLHIADILRDTETIVQARKLAAECMASDEDREEVKNLVQMQLDERFQGIFNS